MHAEPDDLRSRLTAAQIIGVIRVLYYEARRSAIRPSPPERWRAYADGLLCPAHVESPFDQAADAVELVATRSNPGRVLLRAA